MSNILWYNKISILFDNYKDFYPKKSMNKTEKLNAIARLAIYYGIIIIVLKLDNKWLSVSILLLGLTIFLGNKENFETIVDYKACTKPTLDNPYMNFTLGDNINNPLREKACVVNEKIRNDELNFFTYNNKIIDTNDLFGTKISDRNFYTMPSTGIINDQTAFAKFLYGSFGKCKSENKDCLKNRDNKYHRSRLYYQY
jgi:hypothetical protein